ncbi:ABC transporter substrate-binding protein [Aquipseudomonas alcaligenes]|uniref:substrate-binding periplasmic protein n=1 Tax=Aquipseudomonas alcaligenes TaxID=43263 RepID=UPI00165915F8|nr:transporter substrate-binding domain-containing protein [Pseudomonas alcaligenes]
MISCLLLFGWLHAPLACAETYQIVTEEWAPYNYNEQGKIRGMATDIVRAVMHLAGDDFEIIMLPSMRTVHVLQTRPKTIMYSLFRTPEREALYKWVGPIVEESIHPYQLRSAPQRVTTLAELRQARRITTRIAGLVPNVLQTAGFQNLDRSANSSEQLYRMLLAGRTEIIVGDTDAGVRYYSQQLGISAATLQKIPVEIYKSSLYIAFSRDCDDALIARWADALAQLRRTGIMQIIQQRYEPPTD